VRGSVGHPHSHTRDSNSFEVRAPCWMGSAATRRSMRYLRCVRLQLLAGVALIMVVLREELRALGRPRNEATKTVVAGNWMNEVERSQSALASPIIADQTENGDGVVFRHRILCYGDSLTAGVDLAIQGSMFPYAPVLRRLLQETNPKRAYQVYANGYAGWAAEELHDVNAPWLGPHGSIADVLRQSGNETTRKNADNTFAIECASISLAIILIGTNDVNRCNSSAEEVFDHIRYLHHDALYGGGRTGDNSSDVARTIAVEIPGSIYHLSEPLRAEKAAAVNAKLAAFATVSMEPRTTFMPFPFRFVPPDEIGNLKEQLGLERQDSNIWTTLHLPAPARFWSQDGIHLSPPGYEQLAKSLVPVVEEALTLVERDCRKA
jgi:lysophospholipase L1-like esterase